MDCGVTQGERRPKPCSSECRQKEGYCMCRERETCNECVKGEGRRRQVQLTVGRLRFPQHGVLPAVCHTGTVWGLRQPVSSHPQRALCW